MKSFTAELIDELEILALYNLDNHQDCLLYTSRCV